MKAGKLGGKGAVKGIKGGMKGLKMVSKASDVAVGKTVGGYQAGKAAKEDAKMRAEFNKKKAAREKEKTGKAGDYRAQVARPGRCRRSHAT